MDTVLFITELHIGAQIAKISGVFSQARRHGWHVIEIERDRTTRPVADFIESRKPIGCIYECSGLASPPSDIPVKLPTVILDPAPPSRKLRRLEVASDDAAIAEMAVGELVAAGCRTFAFAGWRKRTGWSVQRGRAFAEALRKRGCDCTMIDAP